MGLGTFLTGIVNQVNPLDEGRTYADGAREAEFNANHRGLSQTGVDPREAYTAIKRYNNASPSPSDLFQRNTSNLAARENQGGGVLGATTGAQRNGFGGSGGSSVNPDDLRYLDTQEGLLRRLLESAASTRQSGLDQIGNLTNRETSAANQGRGRALEDFQLQREDTTGAKQDALGRVDTNARTLADSLRRILGMASGSGSSAYQFAAPNAIARYASGQRSGVLNDFGENERDLSLAERRATEDYDGLLQNIQEQANQRRQSLEGGVMEQRQGIFEELANLAAERAKLQGGGYDSIMSAQKPYMNRINSIQGNLDSLPSRFMTPFELNPVNVQAPSLRDYTVDRAAINTQNQGGGQYSPYDFFLRRNKEERQA